MCLLTGRWSPLTAIEPERRSPSGQILSDSHNILERGAVQRAELLWLRNRWDEIQWAEDAGAPDVDSPLAVRRRLHVSDLKPLRVSFRKPLRALSARRFRVSPTSTLRLTARDSSSAPSENTVSSRSQHCHTSPFEDASHITD